MKVDAMVTWYQIEKLTVILHICLHMCYHGGNKTIRSPVETKVYYLIGLTLFCKQ